MKISIRKERPSDREDVFAVHVAAFETQEEARAVDAVRANAEPVISLVAALGEQLVGHVLFSPVTLPGGVDGGRAMGLAPLAVSPEHQNLGIGSRLVRAGLAACRHIGRDVVFVLGHEDYYPRFGFEPAARHGFLFQGAENRHFMVLGLRAKALKGLSGSVRYRREFDEP